MLFAGGAGGGAGELEGEMRGSPWGELSPQVTERGAIKERGSLI